MEDSAKKKQEWRLTDTPEPREEAMAEKVYVGREVDFQELLDLAGYQIIRLKDQAARYIDEFWAHHLEQNKSKSLASKSQLGCRMRLKGDSIYLEWFHNYWYKGTNPKTGKEGQRPVSKYISRGKGFSYPIKTLLRYSEEWEHDMVVRTEEALTHIRRQNHFLAMARQNIREAIKSREALSTQEQL